MAENEKKHANIVAVFPKITVIFFLPPSGSIQSHQTFRRCSATWCRYSARKVATHAILEEATEAGKADCCVAS